MEAATEISVQDVTFNSSNKEILTFTGRDKYVEGGE